MSPGFKQLFLKIFFFLSAALFLAAGFATSRLTERQREALGKYVGKNYWVVFEEAKDPPFLSAPAPSATSFIPEAKALFQITELVEGSAQGPYYYKVKFGSGREGYLPVDFFLEQLNSTFLTVDPDRGQKLKSAKETEAESKREARIRAQPWPEHVKEAALKRQAILGMNMKETRVALGKPTRVVKIKNSNPLMGQQEQWIYQSGPVLTFTNGVITRIQSAEDKAE